MTSLTGLGNRSGRYTLAGVWRSATSIMTAAWTRSCSIRTNRSFICTTGQKHPATSSGSAWRVPGRIGMGSGRGSRFGLAGGAGVLERYGGGSYQSASDPRLHFGLGEFDQVDSVEVRWPSGRVEQHSGLAADREYRLREGASPVEVRHNPHHP